jgi:hypothetical protein
MTDVVVAASLIPLMELGMPRLHRQRILGPVQRLHLALLLHAQHDRVLGARYSPTMSTTLASSSGSVENLNVSAFHGLTPYSFQIAADHNATVPGIDLAGAGSEDQIRRYQPSVGQGRRPALRRCVVTEADERSHPDYRQVEQVRDG